MCLSEEGVHEAFSVQHKVDAHLFSCRSSGVTTTTLLALAAASGVFSAGIGFIAGYKTSPSFAYMRIPSLV